MKLFCSKHRERYLSEMAANELDLLVIGGGITGAGIAWDASSRGLNIGLVEMGDFSWGTSSRSTKLVHGGLRYLKQGEVRLVMEVGRERALLHKSAPHIVTPEPMILPLYKKGTYSYWMTSIGLYIYDVLAGVKGKERRRMYRRSVTEQLEPLLKKEDLKGSGYYYEYRTDDSRLTMEVLKTAFSHGANIVNYAKAQEFIYKDGKIVGARIMDVISGKIYEVYAKQIVNAAGPWVDRVRELDNSLQGKRLFHTKGVHLVVDYSKLPIRQAAYFDVPDGRMIFVIPRDGKTYIGTTDTVYEESIESPRTTQEDVAYLIQAVNAMFVDVHLTEDDVESCWAGIRPLVFEEGKGPSEISRKDEVFISGSGLVTIAGGKLTGFRKMAQKVVDLVARHLSEAYSLQTGPCVTDQDTLSGGDHTPFHDFKEYKNKMLTQCEELGMTPDTARYLFSRYGANLAEICRIYEELTNIKDQEQSLKHLTAAERILLAEMMYTVENEMVTHAVDFIVRRTGLLFFDIERVHRIKFQIVEWLGEWSGWDQAEKQRQLELVEKEIAATKPISAGN